MLNLEQCDVNNHLRDSHLVDAVWNSMLDVLPLMEKFLQYGGRYEGPLDVNDTLPYSFIEYGYEYPIPVMRVLFDNNWLLLTRDVRYGYPVIKLWSLDRFTYDKDKWNKCLVHPTHLDRALCYIFEIPDTNSTH